MKPGPGGVVAVTGTLRGGGRVGDAIIYGLGSDSTTTFVALFDTTGIMLWVKEITGEFAVTAIAASTNMVAIGGKAFNPTTLFLDDLRISQELSQTTLYWFVLSRIDGTFRWFDRAGPAGSESEAQRQITGLSFNSREELFTTGILRNSTTFSARDTINVEVGHRIGYFTRHRKDGAMDFAQALYRPTDVSWAQMYAIDILSDGPVLAGTATGTVHFSDVDSISYGFGQSAFVVAFDRDGAFKWVTGVHGGGATFGDDVKVGLDRRIVFAGSYSASNTMRVGRFELHPTNNGRQGYFLEMNEFGDVTDLKTVTTSTGEQYLRTVALGSNRQTYVGVSMADTATFGAIRLVSTGESTAMLGCIGPPLPTVGGIYGHDDGPRIDLRGSILGITLDGRWQAPLTVSAYSLLGERLVEDVVPSTGTASIEYAIPTSIIKQPAVIIVRDASRGVAGHVFYMPTAR